MVCLSGEIYQLVLTVMKMWKEKKRMFLFETLKSSYNYEDFCKSLIKKKYLIMEKD